MCREGLSLEERLEAESAIGKGKWKKERRVLRKIFRDLALRCRGRRQGIDQVEFMKFTSLPGLLGQQCFQALDTDKDGLLDQAEFLTGVVVLYKGNWEETEALLCRLLDVSGQGQVTQQGVAVIAEYLPKTCPKCELSAPPLRWPSAPLSPFALRCPFYTLLTALLASFPPLLSEAMKADTPFSDLSTCSGSIPGPLPHVLTYTGRTYSCEVAHQSLYLYSNEPKATLKHVIYIGNLCLSTLPPVTLELYTLSRTYTLTAESPAELEQWRLLIEAQLPSHSFTRDYEVQELLGQGAYGQVYRTLQLYTALPYAVKVFDKATMNGHDEERLRREIDVLRLVHHDNLLHLQEIYESPQYVHIITDLIVGVPLIAWLEQQGYLTSETTARGMVLDIARALTYLHDRGVIHRDVKLENVMVERREGRLRARLIDYGLACFAGPGQRESEPVGTLKYAAPEVIARTGYTAKADCWSLGVILYILLQGKVPFFGDSEQQVAYRIQHKRLDFTSSKWGCFSPSCLEVLTGLMRRREAKRLSAGEVLKSEWALEEEVEEDSEDRCLPVCLQLHTPFQKTHCSSTSS